MYYTIMEWDPKCPPMRVREELPISACFPSCSRCCVSQRSGGSSDSQDILFAGCRGRKMLGKARFRISLTEHKLGLTQNNFVTIQNIFKCK